MSTNNNLFNESTLSLFIGSTIHNNNGDDYVILGYNPELDYALLKQVSTKPIYVVAWALQGDKERCFWSQGHYFMNNYKEAMEFMLYGKEIIGYERAIELLNKVIDYAYIGNSSEEVITELSRIGFESEELINAFYFSRSDVEYYYNMGEKEENEK